MKQESLAGLIGDQLRGFDKLDNDANERARSYPANYEAYSALPVEDRLTVAMGVIRDEKPFNKKDEDSGDRLFCFPIMDEDELAETGVQIVAQVAYEAETYRRIYPALVISVETSRDNHIDSSNLATLEQVTGLGPSHTIVVRGYQVRSAIDFEKVLTDPKGKLFKNVVYVVDKGVAELYKTKLDTRIAKLGKLATGA